MKLVFNMFPGTTPVRMVMADTRKVYAASVLLHRALVEGPERPWVRRT